MHPIQLMEESTLEALGSVGQSSTSWIIAAILGAVLLGILVFIVVRKRRDNEESGYTAGARPKKNSLPEDFKPIVRSGDSSESSGTNSIRSGTEV